MYFKTLKIDTQKRKMNKEEIYNKSKSLPYLNEVDFKKKLIICKNHEGNIAFITFQDLITDTIIEIETNNYSFIHKLIKDLFEDYEFTNESPIENEFTNLRAIRNDIAGIKNILIFFVVIIVLSFIFSFLSIL